LWPLFDVLFANPARLASLTAQQRGWLQQAAVQASTNSAALVAGRNGPYVKQACALGARFATATPADLAALRAAFPPVYRALDRDPQTRAFIGQIKRPDSVVNSRTARVRPASRRSGHEGDVERPQVTAWTCSVRALICSVRVWICSVISVFRCSNSV
jgi:hypothetical protein